jgi:hypothetical protein
MDEIGALKALIDLEVQISERKHHLKEAQREIRAEISELEGRKMALLNDIHSGQARMFGDK